MNNKINPQELNQRAEMIINLANKGMSPQSVMQQFVVKNAQYPQYMNQAFSQLNNMAEGRPLNEFMLQALKQNGLSEKNAENIARLLNIK